MARQRSPFQRTSIPEGFKRNSSGFLDPIGRVPSGTTSGPTAAQRTQMAEDAMKKVVASYGTAQKEHERVMSDIAKAESDKFDKINAALNASKESDPKDKLGNTVPSKQTQYLEAQLMNILGQRSQRGKALTPESAGIQRGQLDETGQRLREPSSPGGPGGQAPSAPGGEQDFSQPATAGETVEVTTASGNTVQVTVVAPADNRGMVRVRLQDGSEAAVPQTEINRINLGDPIPGEPAPDPGGQRQRFFEHAGRRAGVLDTLTGL